MDQCKQFLTKKVDKISLGLEEVFIELAIFESSCNVTGENLSRIICWEGKDIEEEKEGILLACIWSLRKKEAKLLHSSTEK